MPEQLDLLAFAGLDSGDKPCAAKSPRSRKPRPPSPAERAASGRLEGARRSRPALRDRVGPTRQVGTGEVVAFPLSRNATLLEDAVRRLPHGYSEELDDRCEREARNLANRLARQGLPKQAAQRCARELLDQAYIRRVTDAHKEAGVL